MTSRFLADGRPLYLSQGDYLDLIVKKKGCFICGVSEDESEFNFEHVVPNWILRDLKIHHTNVTKSDGRAKFWSTHTIPCCKRCNSLLGVQIEEPMSKLLNENVKAFTKHIANPETFKLLYCWLANIAYKSIHSDLYARVHKPGTDIKTLGELHEWANMHHLNVLCRLFFDENDISTDAIGTFRIFIFSEDKDDFTPEGFDFVTFFQASSMFLRFRTFGFLVVFDDGGASGNVFDNYFVIPKEGLKGDIRSIDCRHTLVEMSTINFFLSERPQYYSETEQHSRRSITKVKFPRAAPIVNFDPFDENDRAVRTRFMQSAFEHIRPHLPVDKQLMLDEGRLGFLEDIGYVRRS